MRLRNLILPTLGGLWAVLVVVASNAPEDVEARAKAWLALPILKWVPLAVLEFASSRIVIGLTFLAAGMVIGWRLKARAGKSTNIEWCRAAAKTMTNVAVNIERYGSAADKLDWLNGQIHAVEATLRRKGFAFPTPANGFTSVEDYPPFLYRVAPLIGTGELDSARAMAAALAAAKK